MDIGLAQRHRTLNRLQSILLLMAMVGLLVVVGWLFAGALGVAWSLVLAIVMPGKGVSEPSILRTHPHTRDRLERLRSLQPLQPVQELRASEIPGFLIQSAQTRRPRWRKMGMWY